MKITWLAHACFLIEGEGLRIITDPYTPEIMGFPPVVDGANLVIRSSADDLGHCRSDLIPGSPTVITATDAIADPKRFRGITVQAIGVKESLIHKESPIDNAMYRFSLDGIDVAHFGDVGNPLTESQLEGLHNTDVVLVPAGGPPTIELADLVEALGRIKPRIIVPMHYHLPGSKASMFPVDQFTSFFPGDAVQRKNSTSLVLKRRSLPPTTRVVVLQSKLVPTKASPQI